MIGNVDKITRELKSRASDVNCYDPLKGRMDGSIMAIVKRQTKTLVSIQVAATVFSNIKVFFRVM
eukprot:Nk52_evm42s240 gene=Nk52_evmTU42s240